MHGELTRLSTVQDKPDSQSANDVSRTLDECLKRQEYTQLIVVGSPVDIAWVHSTLTEAVARSVVAEVRYPLLVSWFSGAEEFLRLKQVLESVVSP